MSTRPVSLNFGDGILCPNCGGKHSRVTDSRPHKDAILRKRICINCNSYYTTQEVFLSTNVPVRPGSHHSIGATT